MAGGGRLMLSSSFIVGVNEPHSIGTLSSAAHRIAEGGFLARPPADGLPSSISSGSRGSLAASPLASRLTETSGRSSPAILSG